MHIIIFEAQWNPIQQQIIHKQINLKLKKRNDTNLNN